LTETTIRLGKHRVSSSYGFESLTVAHLPATFNSGIEFFEPSLSLRSATLLKQLPTVEIGERTSFPREVAGAALAHLIGNETERAYRRGDALEKRRDLMDAWALLCAAEARDAVVSIAIGQRKSSAHAVVRSRYTLRPAAHSAQLSAQQKLPRDQQP
jgi:hypothetical protein